MTLPPTTRTFTGRKALLAVWLCSATVVTVARVLHESDPGYDLGIQLQAAHNLVAGRGLSIYRHVAPNLTDPARLLTLTYFPAGYSLLAAALMKLGLSVGMAIKVLGALGTMLGWWGWATLSRRFFGEGWQRGQAWRLAAVAIAAATPLLFTPLWGGTDILLWAIVPWVVACTVRGSDENAAGGWRFDLLAGVLCGLALLMRYASLFLVVYAGSLMLWQSRSRIRSVALRWGAFGAGALPALALQGYVNYALANSPVTPGGLSIAAQGLAFRRLWVGWQLLRHADYLWAFWAPGSVASLLFAGGIGAPPWRVGLTLCAMLALLLATVTYAVAPGSAWRDSRIAALGLFAAVPLTLLACMTLSPTNYVAERRYYWPIVPLALFVAYSISSMPDLPPARRVLKLFQRFCALYLTAYVAMSLVYVLFLFLPGRIGTSERTKLLGGDPHRWPSMGVSYEFSSSRRLVMQLLAERPDAVLLTGRGGAFYWDPRVDGARLQELRCDALQAAYVDGPVTIVILTFDEGQPDDLWYYLGNAASGSLRRASCFEGLPDLHLVQRFPEEGMKVLQARVAAGDHILLP